MISPATGVGTPAQADPLFDILLLSGHPPGIRPPKGMADLAACLLPHRPHAEPSAIPTAGGPEFRKTFRTANRAPNPD